MRVLRQLSLLTLPVLLTFSQITLAAPSSSVSFNKQQLTQRFALIGIQVEEAKVSDHIDGLIELQTPAGVIYSSPTGDHFIAGTLYSLDKQGQYKDVMAERQQPINAKKIAAMKDSTIEYKAKDEKYIVTVFTDTTCGYCAKLHSEMAEYNDLGITVRYMAYPRQGPNGGVATQMAKVWCAKDPQTAMHEAKLNRVFPEDSHKDLATCQKIVQDHYQLGSELGINGTPAIFLPDGKLVGGYVPPKKLLQILQQQ